MKKSITRKQFFLFGIAIGIFGLLFIFTVHDYGFGIFLCLASIAYVVKSLWKHPKNG